MFDATPEHAAAEEKRVEIPPVGAALGDHEADETVVAEAIADADGADLVVPTGGESLHVRFLATDRREVELVGSERQLRRSTEIVAAHRSELDLELQVLDEIVEGQRRGAQFLPAELFLVERRPPGILLGGFAGVELPEVTNQLSRTGRLLRPLDGEHLGAAGPYFGALHRVVVDEDEAVEAEIEPPRQRAEVLRLRQPVDRGGNHLLALEREIGSRLEHAPDVGLLVLAAQAHENAALGEARQQRVQRTVAVVELHAFGTDLADDAAPQRVVAVHHHDLACRHQTPVHVPGGNRGEHIQVVVAIGNVRDVVAQRVVHGVFVDAVVLVKLRRRYDVQTGERAKAVEELLLGLAHQNALGRRGRAVGWTQQQQRFGGGLIAMRADGCLKVAGGFLQESPDAFGIAPMIVGELAKPVEHPHQHDVGAGASGVEDAGGVQQRLHYLAVGRDLDRRVERQFLRPELERRYQRVGGEGGSQPKAERRRLSGTARLLVGKGRKRGEHLHAAGDALGERVDDPRGGPVGRNRADDARRRVVPPRLQNRRTRHEPGDGRMLANSRAHQRFACLFQRDVVAESGRRLVHEGRRQERHDTPGIGQSRRERIERRFDEPEVLADVPVARFGRVAPQPEHGRRGARVQDQQVEPPVLRANGGGRFGAPGWVAGVAGEELEVRTAAVESLVLFLTAVGRVPGARVDVCAGKGEGRREIGAQAAASAGNESHFTRERAGGSGQATRQPLRLRPDRAERNIAA